MDTGKLYVTIGLPRSGKSTVCNTKRQGNPQLVVLSGDTFRNALYNGVYNRSAEPFIFATLDIAAKALLMEGYDVIIDETCTDIRTALRYIAIDPDVQFILVDTPKEECIRRALINKQGYLVSVIEWQSRNLESMRPLIATDFKYFRDLEKKRKIRDQGEPQCLPPQYGAFWDGLMPAVTS